MESNSPETAVYSKRWLILAAVCSINFFTNFGAKTFTVANQSYAKYYNVSLLALDWSDLAVYLGAAICTPIFAWFFFKQNAGLRILLIIGTFSLLISFFVIVLSIQFPKLYTLMIFSNLLQGISYMVSVTVGPSFAVIWFPNEEVALAIAIDLLSHNVGLIMGSILPPTLLNTYSITNAANITIHQQETWKSNTHKMLLLLYIACIITLFILLLLFIAFMVDQPLKPPTKALWVKGKTTTTEQPKSTGSLLQFIQAVKSLHQDLNFVLCSLCLNFTFCLNIVLYLHITAILDHFNIRKMGINIANDIFGGIIIVSSAFARIIFSFVSVKISYHWKNYAGQALAGSVLNLFAVLGTTLAFYFRNFLVFCICLIFLYSLGLRIFAIPLYEVITRHTYPIDETFVNVWSGVSGCFLFVINAEFARIISMYAPPVYLLIYMSFCVFVSFVIALIIKPKDKRREVDDMEHNPVEESNKVEESSPLLKED